MSLVKYFENKFESWINEGYTNEVWSETDEVLNILNECFDNPAMAEDIKKYDYAAKIDNIRSRIKEKGNGQINKIGLKGYYNEAYPKPEIRF